ncbi:putative two-component response regulator [Pseudomonas aeruginosa PADK2_CF510]|nr:putative two-component response regulator [Pseudomonas aeruginosa PADK2_CF510]
MVIRVLVAEDHTIVREGIKQLIGMAKDLQVVGEATNGEQLLETLRGALRGGPAGYLHARRQWPRGDSADSRAERAAGDPGAVDARRGADGRPRPEDRCCRLCHQGSDPALLLTAIRRVAGGGRYIDPDLADRMVFEVGLTDSRPPHALLSEREFSVFERLVQGANVNEIAQQLAVSNKTISTHKARLMQKLNAHSVADLVRYAMEHRLL